jgi:HNH endonuclease
LEIDHIQPISQGGTGEKENLQVLCVSCNRKKRAEQMRSKVNAEPTQMCSLEREGEGEAEKRRILVADASKDESFLELRKVYPKRKGSDPGPPAAKLFLAAVKAGTEPQIIIEGARRFAVVESQNINTPYIPQLVKWLRDKRWLDHPSGSTAQVIDIRSSLV